MLFIEHLLKIHHVKGQIGLDNFRGWKTSVRDQQNELADHIHENPGLKSKLTDRLVDKVYRQVVADLKQDYPGIQFPHLRQLPVMQIAGENAASMLKNA